jgi:polyisoprenoid-binding protein YceI
MKKVLFTAALFVATGVLHAQEKYFTKSGNIKFSSKAPMENIEAVNKSVTCVLDTKTGDIQFAVLMKGFEFVKALMQDHFNENYVESDKFPKGEFKGQLENVSSLNIAQDGAYPVNVTGKLTMHGITKDVKADGKIIVQNGKVSASSDFAILLSDYDIKIPSLVENNISNTININVDCALETLNK